MPLITTAQARSLCKFIDKYKTYVKLKPFFQISSNLFYSYKIRSSNLNRSKPVQVTNCLQHFDIHKLNS